MNIFKVIGRGFKWIGGKILWFVRRDEVLLIARFVPIPAFDEILTVVRAIDSRGKKSGPAKLIEAMALILPILAAYDIKLKDESTLRFIIETAIQVMKGTARVVPMKEDE